MDKISIDYAVTEKMNPSDVLIIQGEFEWKDIGAWDTLHENMLTKTDERRNLVRGERLNIDTSGCIIYGGDKKLIATVGLDDLVIIDTEDALLICPKGRSQEVKKVVEELKERGGKYL
jgi:mannose-1-phosphate guanylyltransferase